MRPFFAALFEEADGGARIVSFEGLRGFAALLVFLVHFDALAGGYISSSSGWFRLSEAAGRFGHTGVDVFFVLSGFLVYGIIMRGRWSTSQFLVRRFRRLYPAFAAVFAIYVVISVFVPSQSKIPHGFSNAALYLAANLAMLPGVFPIKPFIAVAWSLSYELAFYAVLPLIFAILRLRKWTPRNRILLFLGFAAILIAASLHVRMIMFVAGIVLWELANDSALGGRLPAAGEWVAIAVFSANLLLIGTGIGAGGLGPLTVSQFYSVPLFVSVSALTLYATFFDGILKGIFCWRPIRWVGNISYSYYLIHGLTLHAVREALSAAIHGRTLPAMLGPVLFVVCLAATLIAAAGLYLAIEKPLSFARRPVRRLAPTVADSPAAAGAPVNAI